MHLCACVCVTINVSTYIVFSFPWNELESVRKSMNSIHNFNSKVENWIGSFWNDGLTTGPAHFQIWVWYSGSIRIDSFSYFGIIFQFSLCWNFSPNLSSGSFSVSSEFSYSSGIAYQNSEYKNSWMLDKFEFLKYSEA